MANPTIALKIISNFDVLSTANISDCPSYFLAELQAFGLSKTNKSAVSNRMINWYDIGYWHFKLVPLLAGLAAGAFVAHFYKPETQIIHQYPHPSDAKSKVFKDHNGICYTYTSHEVNCDANEGTLKDYPVQG